MLCARVIRGMSSSANVVTPSDANEPTGLPGVMGSARPMTVWPERSSGTSASPVAGLASGVRTWRRTSLEAYTSARGAIFAPLSA